jgi:Zn-dependent protease with chaperone function
MTNITVEARKLRALGLFLVLAMAQALAQSPELPDPGNTRVTREQQRELGLQAAAEVYKQMPVLPDNSPETQYIRQLGQKLAATIPSEYSWPFEFHVIPQKEINAFALPGGPMFVNVGTILAARNEAELAGVMGHEMAHVYMQHSAKQYEKASVTQGLAGLAGAILGAKGGALGSLAQMGVQIGAGTLMLKYSRGDESQADAVGSIILYKAGYNPQSMADFFRTLAEESGGGGGPQFLSDHPNPGNREAAIQKAIQGWPPRNFQTSSSGFNKVRQHANGVKLYTGEEIAAGAKSGQWDSLNRKNGAVFKGAPASSSSGGSATPVSSTSGPVSLQDVMPSGTLRNANLGPLSISHPDNWDVIQPTQQGAGLTIAPRAGVVSNGVGYGVVINGGQAQNGANLDDITKQIVQGMQSGGGDLRTIGSPQKITVNGASGRSVPMQSTSPFPDSKGQAQKERDWLVTVQQPDGSVLYMVFVAPESQWDKFKPTYQSMLRSVKF